MWHLSLNDDRCQTLGTLLQFGSQHIIKRTLRSDIVLHVLFWNNCNVHFDVSMSWVDLVYRWPCDLHLHHGCADPTKQESPPATQRSDVQSFMALCQRCQGLPWMCAWQLSTVPKIQWVGIHFVRWLWWTELCAYSANKLCVQVTEFNYHAPKILSFLLAAVIVHLDSNGAAELPKFEMVTSCVVLLRNSPECPLHTLKIVLKHKNVSSLLFTSLRLLFHAQKRLSNWVEWWLDVTCTVGMHYISVFLCRRSLTAMKFTYMYAHVVRSSDIRRHIIGATITAPLLHCV